MSVEDIKSSEVLAAGTSKGVVLCFVSVLLQLGLVPELDRTLNTSERMLHFNALVAFNMGSDLMKETLSLSPESLTTALD